MRRPEIITDATRFQLNVPHARLAASLVAISLIFHRLEFLELAAVCLPFCMHVQAPRWTKMLFWAFFVPFLIMALLGSATVPMGSNALSNLLLSMYYLGLPTGFICLLFVSAWLAICAVGTSMCNYLRRLG